MTSCDKSFGERWFDSVISEAENLTTTEYLALLDRSKTIGRSEALLNLADKALQSLEQRKNEDHEEWADRLLDDVLPIKQTKGTQATKG